MDSEKDKELEKQKEEPKVEEPKKEEWVEPELSFPINKEPEKAEAKPQIDELVQQRVEAVLDRIVDKMTQKHNKEIDELKAKLSILDDKLPKTITPNKVEGYYDFNDRTNEFLNQAAKNDYNKAKSTLDYVRSIFK